MAQIEITGVFVAEKFRFPSANGDNIVGSIRIDDDLFTIKGNEADVLEFGQQYRFFGRWTTYRNRRTGDEEKQFKFDCYVISVPASRAGVISYLMKVGKGLGVGKAKATKLWELVGSGAVKVAREHPDQLAHAIKIPREKAAIVAERLKELAHVEETTIALMGLLDKRGFPKATTKACVDSWGSVAAVMVQLNPYLLMRFRGCGFKLCDKMYLDLGLPRNRLKRQALCAWYSIASDTTGHTWFSAKDVIQGILDNVQRTKADPTKAIKLAIRAGLIESIRVDRDRIVDLGGDLYFAEASKARHERRIARILVDSADEVASWPEIPTSSTVTDHQRDALAKATRQTIGSLGGSPGTGKTYVAAELIKSLIYYGRTIAVAAPTGKAAVRITEALDAAGINLRAKTIHSLLGIDMAAEGGGWHFKHHAGKPLPYQVIVVDEVSMVDTDLMCSLLDARARGTHVLFVGDIGQLPPVGHGAPLRDMQIPFGYLTEIQRNAGMIVEACHAMKRGERFVAAEEFAHDSVDNLGVIEAKYGENQMVVLKQLLQYAKEEGFNPVWDCQVVCAVNKKSEVSREALNKYLQSILNDSPGVNGSPFRVDDKIVCLKNGYYPAAEDIGIEFNDSDEAQQNENGDYYVANGEQARVIESLPNLVVVELSAPFRRVKIPRGNSRNDSNTVEDVSSSAGCSWDLAYAISVHKSQGSEWPIVLVIIDEYPGARMVCDRSWLYTALSRGKKLGVIVGQLGTAHRFAQQQKINQRRTMLKTLMLVEQSKLVLAEI